MKNVLDKIMKELETICKETPDTGIAVVVFNGKETATGVMGSLNLHAVLHGIDSLMHQAMKLCDKEDPEALVRFMAESELKSKLGDLIKGLISNEGSDPLRTFVESMSPRF